MKVRGDHFSVFIWGWSIDPFRAVDYILFITADVDVTPNPNEIRDHKYVSKEELQAMFEDSGWCFRLLVRGY